VCGWDKLKVETMLGDQDWDEEGKLVKGETEHVTQTNDNPHFLSILESPIIMVITQTNLFLNNTCTDLSPRYRILMKPIPHNKILLEKFHKVKIM